MASTSLPPHALAVTITSTHLPDSSNPRTSEFIIVSVSLLSVHQSQYRKHKLDITKQQNVDNDDNHQAHDDHDDANDDHTHDAHSHRAHDARAHANHSLS